MMRTMAIELAPKIRVNAVNPGYTMTPMQEAEYSPEMLEQVNGVIPMRRHARPRKSPASMSISPPTRQPMRRVPFSRSMAPKAWDRLQQSCNRGLFERLL